MRAPRIKVNISRAWFTNQVEQELAGMSQARAVEEAGRLQAERALEDERVQVKLLPCAAAAAILVSVRYRMRS